MPRLTMSAVLLLIVTAAPAQRPNFVVLLCDDMGFSDIGCYGSEIATPSVDGLARDGLRFRQFYNNAKCTTTRASLVTGLYPRRGGHSIRLLDDRMTTVAEALGRAGYQTSLSGKWHLGSRRGHRPVDRGFDEYYGLMDGCCNFFDPSQRDPEFKGSRVRVFGRNDGLITEFPEDYYTTDAFTDHAIETVGRFAAKKKPFFVHVAYTAPHYPLHARESDIEPYLGKYSEGWEVLRQRRWSRLVASGFIPKSWAKPGRGRRVPTWESRKHKRWDDRRMATYAAMISSMDRNIGRLLDALDAHGVAKNTVVMFLSDNGGCAETPGGDDPSRIPGPREFYTHCGPGWAWAQNTPFRRFKSWAHEGGIATPMVVRWPARVKAGTWTSSVGHVIDIMPTLLELAGVDATEATRGRLPPDGESLAGVLAGKERVRTSPLFWEWAGHRAVREGDLKLVWNKRDKAWELYDMISDRTEMRNLAPERPEVSSRLAAAWRDWAKRHGIRRR